MIHGMPGIGGSLGKCQVCGESFMLEVVTGDSVVTGSIPGIDGELCVHKKCVPILTSGCEWTELPDGPLKQVYADAHAEDRIDPVSLAGE